MSTMPPNHLQVDGGLEGSGRRNVATRPTSLYSIRSMTPSLPPYEGHEPLDTIPDSNEGHPLPSQSAPVDRDLQSTPPTSDDSEPPMTASDSVNTLSLHYGRIVRTIDENHGHQLARIRQDHERELAATRNAIDEAYRKELKSKNREIERIREEAANEIEKTRREAAADVAAIQEEIEILSTDHSETLARMQRENAEQILILRGEHQAATEKAKHVIEDLWEGRWNDRSKVAAEEAKRAAEEAERRSTERNSAWLTAIERTHPELLDEIVAAMQNPWQ